jgi:hypothetical protein
VLFRTQVVGNYYVTYSWISKRDTKKETREETIRKRQSEWEETTKGAITKNFFPSVERRLAVNLHLNSYVTTIMFGHGNIRSYLHRLKLTDRQSRVSMQTRHTNSRSFDIAV